MSTSASKGRFWPMMIFGMIGLNFCIVGVTVYAARFHSSSFAVEPDYDTKALHWENTARQVRRNVDLGWRIDIKEAQGQRLAVVIRDKQGNLIDGAGVNVEAFHHARAQHKVIAAMKQEPGLYSARADLTPAGLWEFRFTVLHGSTLFTQSVTQLVSGTEVVR